MILVVVGTFDPAVGVPKKRDDENSEVEEK
jgi:hypothetical protein